MARNRSNHTAESRLCGSLWPGNRVDWLSMRTPVGRYIAVGSWVGLLVGALEAAYKCRYPMPAVLLEPDVGCAIWLVGPLADALAGGLVGLLLGLLVAGLRRRRARYITLGLALGAAGLVVWAIARDPRYALSILTGPFPTPFRIGLRAAVLLAAAGAVALARRLPWRWLRASLAVVFVALLLGVGIYHSWQPLRRGDVAASRTWPRGAPNVILITLDTVRADHLSLYGYARPTTPRLDRWAERGVVFANAIAPSCWTLPSHASIFTGLLPHQHGANFAEPLSRRWWTLGEVLSWRGYETAGFTSNLIFGGMGWGMGNGLRDYDDDSVSLRHNLRSLLLGGTLLDPLYRRYLRPDGFERREARQINRDVLRWLQHRSPRPYYLFINYFDAHGPYLVPPSYGSRFGTVSPWRLGQIDRAIVAENNSGRLSAGEDAALNTSYDNCLAYLDDSVGALLDALARLPDGQNTIVIITSDHGESFGEHGTYSHGFNLYREVLHVPLIVLGPGIPAGRRIPRVVRLQDLFQTVLHLTGMHNPPFEQDSLARFWQPDADAGGADEAAVSELVPEDLTAPIPISLTTSAWHYLRNTQGREELYRWPGDPREQTDLAGSPPYREVLDGLRRQLAAVVAESLRPWRRPEYVSAVPASAGSAGGVEPSRSATALHPGPTPRLPIGSAQAFFPRRAFTSAPQPLSPDRELLQSLPYH
jgi:arylsulfatase A-like enzyme